MTTSPITSLSYSTKDPQLLAGGCYSGQICWWDVRAGSRPVGAVEFEHCHSEPVYSTIWTASKSGTELMTGGSDGFVRSIFNNLDDKQTCLLLDGGTSEILKKRKISLLWTQKIRILNIQVKIYRLKPFCMKFKPL